MARKKRNKSIKSVDMKNFVLSVIKEAEGHHIKSAEICKRAKEHFELSSKPNDSMVRNMVNTLRMEEGHWQLTATNCGYVWSESDREYRAWKSKFESQINTMIRCLHTIESAYVRDVNEYIVQKGYKPSAECIFNFFPWDLDWTGNPAIENAFVDLVMKGPMPSQPLQKVSSKKPAKRKRKNEKRGAFFKYVKSIRQEGESWKDAMARAKKNWGGDESSATLTDNPQPPNGKGPSSLFKKITKNFGLSKDEE